MGGAGHSSAAVGAVAVGVVGVGGRGRAHPLRQQKIVPTFVVAVRPLPAAALCKERHRHGMLASRVPPNAAQALVLVVDDLASHHDLVPSWAARILFICAVLIREAHSGHALAPLVELARHVGGVRADIAKASEVGRSPRSRVLLLHVVKMRQVSGDRLPQDCDEAHRPGNPARDDASHPLRGQPVKHRRRGIHEYAAWAGCALAPAASPRMEEPSVARRVARHPLKLFGAGIKRVHLGADLDIQGANCLPSETRWRLQEIGVVGVRPPSRHAEQPGKRPGE